MLERENRELRRAMGRTDVGEGVIDEFSAEIDALIDGYDARVRLDARDHGRDSQWPMRTTARPVTVPAM